MATLKPRPVFDPRKDMIVLKTFRAGGRRLVPGQPFNWKQMGVTQRRVQQMYEGSFLTMDDGGVENDDFDFDFDIPQASSDSDAAETDPLEDMTVAELRKLAADSGADKLPRKKDELLALVRSLT